MSNLQYLESAKKEFEYYKQLGEKTFAQLTDEQLFNQINSESNSIATIVKHLWGNMLSRWTDFLTTDGEKEWIKAAENKQPAWCYYDNNPANGTKYGKLYNWYAVSDPRGLAPIGYHLPSNEEWTSFSGLPGGLRARDGSFNEFGRFGFWWTSTDSFSPGYAWSRNEAPNDKNGFGKIESGLMFGKSVRCLKD